MQNLDIIIQDYIARSNRVSDIDEMILKNEEVKLAIFEQFNGRSVSLIELQNLNSLDISLESEGEDNIILREERASNIEEMEKIAPLILSLFEITGIENIYDATSSDSRKYIYVDEGELIVSTDR